MGRLIHHCTDLVSDNTFECVVLKKTQDKAALDKIFKDLDANADGVVDFQEYVTLISSITMLCNENFKKGK